MPGTWLVDSSKTTKQRPVCRRQRYWMSDGMGALVATFDVVDRGAGRSDCNHGATCEAGDGGTRIFSPFASSPRKHSGYPSAILQVVAANLGTGRQVVVSLALSRGWGRSDNTWPRAGFGRAARATGQPEAHPGRQATKAGGGNTMGWISAGFPAVSGPGRDPEVFHRALNLLPSRGPGPRGKSTRKRERKWIRSILGL
jgi:hypothetical protein